MSVSFNVVHNYTTRKISVSRGLVINDVLTQALEKFKIPGGELYYNGKKLDSSLAIRFSNLTNNCKVELKAKKVVQKDIATKVILPDGKTAVQKVSNFTTLAELSSDLDPLNLNINVLNQTISIADNSEKRLADVVGDLDNVVIRFNYHKDTSSEQKRIVEQQLKQQKERLQRQREEREKTPEAPQEAPRSASEGLVEPPQEVPESIKEVDTQERPETKGPIKHLETPEGRQKPETPVTLESPVTLENPVPSGPVIYRPSQTSAYENPDEDYEFTANHAKIYQSTVQYKPRRAVARPTTPQIYRIRIKFPNGYILEVSLLSDQKFGELIKKIDTNLSESHQANYNLKLSYPPFSTFHISFALNSKKLQDIPEFDNNIVLIFVPNTIDHNYLVEGAATRSFSDLPEVQLESNRKNLPDESEPSRHSNGKKVPKWFKLSK